MTEKDMSFEYSYSSREQDEIKKIREKYLSPEEKEIDKMERLRKLDEGVTRKSTAFSLVIGILGALIFGTGMSLAMTDIASTLGAFAIILGVFFGIVGLTIACFAYPSYIYITKKERERIAPEVLKLSEELLK